MDFNEVASNGVYEDSTVVKDEAIVEDIFVDIVTEPNVITFSFLITCPLVTIFESRRLLFVVEADFVEDNNFKVGKCVSALVVEPLAGVVKPRIVVVKPII